MNTFKILLSGLFVFASYASNSYALGADVEEGIETYSLKISLDEKTGTGFVYGKVCDECTKIKVNITPNTRAYAGNTQVALAEAKNRLGKEATVIFNKETMEVVRIRW